MPWEEEGAPKVAWTRRALAQFRRKLLSCSFLSLFFPSFLPRQHNGVEPITMSSSTTSTYTGTSHPDSTKSTSWVTDIHDPQTIGISFGVLLIWTTTQVFIE